MPDRYAVIGNPVAHSKSPFIHAEFAKQTGEAIEYGRIEAPLEAFEGAAARFREAGGCGLNVTVPFKERACRICTSLSARAQAATAVNTLRFSTEGVHGDNTDGVGLVRDLEGNLGVALHGKRVLLAGAGGAARGVMQPLLAAGIALLLVANRTASRAHALAARFAGAQGCGYDELAAERFDLVINATSAGLDGLAPQIPAGVLDANSLAYDMVYGRDTPFLALARSRGARGVDGLGMLVEQAAESFHVWRGVRPETSRVLKLLRCG